MTHVIIEQTMISGWSDRPAMAGMGPQGHGHVPFEGIVKFDGPISGASVAILAGHDLHDAMMCKMLFAKLESPGHEVWLLVGCGDKVGADGTYTASPHSLGSGRSEGGNSDLSWQTSISPAESQPDKVWGKAR
jgi:hypothetical protein